MMGAVRGWLAGVVMVTLLLSVVQMLVPEGPIRKIASFTGGLLLLLTLLRPLLETDIGSLRLELEDYRAAIAEQEATLGTEREKALAAGIAETTAAYISDKAAQLGLTVTVRVETETGPDGVPVPAEVTVEGPRSEALADYLEQELGIPPERQVWQDE